MHQTEKRCDRPKLWRRWGNHKETRAEKSSKQSENNLENESIELIAGEKEMREAKQEGSRMTKTKTISMLRESETGNRGWGGRVRVQGGHLWPCVPSQA